MRLQIGDKMSLIDNLKNAIENRISSLISSHNTNSNAHSNILSTVAKTGNYTDLSNKPTVDSALSTISSNAIQNQTVTNALNNKSNSDHNHNNVYYTENEVDRLISAHNTNSNAHSILLSEKINISDIVDNLNTNTSTKPLSANQGKFLAKLMEAAIYLANDNCLLLDTALVNKSSSYTPVQIDDRGFVQTFSFDSDHYLLSSSLDGFTGWQLSDNRDNVEIAIDFKLANTSAFNQAVLGYFNGNTSYTVRARGDCKVEELIRTYNGNETESTFYTHSTGFADNYYRLKFRRVGTTATISIHTTDGTQLATHNFSITSTSNGKFFFGFLAGTGRDIMVKNIKVQKI